MACNVPGCDTDGCKIYDLCEVTIQGGNCVPSGTNKIVCEGFTFSTKIDTEVKNDCSCYEGYGILASNLQYEWEISNPCDMDWFDQRIVGQLCDKYSMSITGYVQENCGNWVAKETLEACFINDTSREFGKGLTRSLKGIALHRSLNGTKATDNGYANTAKGFQKGVLEGIGDAIGEISKDADYWKSAIIKTNYDQSLAGLSNLGGALSSAVINGVNNLGNDWNNLNNYIIRTGKNLGSTNTM